MPDPLLTAEQTDWQDHARRVAAGIRRRALALTVTRNQGYLSQACSSAEILATLYTHVLRIGPSAAPLVPPPFAGVPRAGRPHTATTGALYNGRSAPHLDRFLCSAAHYAVAVYATLVEVGRLAPEGLAAFNVDGSTVEMIGGEHSPGMEITTGSFGQAISQAGGVALARRLKGETGRVVLFMSDGELEEGQSWEAVQALAFHKVDNLLVYVDVNGQQVDGRTADVMNIEPLHDRLTAFGARVARVDGHDVDALAAPAGLPPDGRPTFVLADTNPSQGIPLLDARKPTLHFIRFKSPDERERFRAFLETMPAGNTDGRA